MFSACDDDDNATDPIGQNTSSFYLLHEGIWGNNDSEISYNNVIENTSVMQHNLYSTANGRRLGDTANDLVTDKGNVFVLVTGSRYIARLSSNGHEVARWTADDTTGDPRYLILHGGDLYVSLYGGLVAKLDTATMQVKATCQVGSYPEEMAVVNNQLVVCNSGYGEGNTLSVIDLNSFTLNSTLEVEKNPTRIIADGRGHAYFLTTTYDANWTPISKVHEFNGQNQNITTIAYANRMALIDEDYLLLIKSDIDYMQLPYRYENEFMIYDLESKRMDNNYFDHNATFCSMLADQNITAVMQNDKEEIYVAVGHQDSNGSLLNSSLHAFTEDGIWQWTLDDVGGINTTTIEFVRK